MSKERRSGDPIEEGGEIPDVIVPKLVISADGKRRVLVSGEGYFDYVYEESK